MTLRKGSKVQFTTKNPTTWGVSAENAKHLKLYHIYTVERVEIHSWHTKIFLKEVPGIEFNSSWFESVFLEYCSSCGRKHRMTHQPCPTCNTYETPQPVSEKVQETCQADYSCDGCQAYREHQA